MKLQLLLFLFVLEMKCEIYKRKKLFVPGDLIIGALIPVHDQPKEIDPTVGAKSRKCSSIRDQYGIQRVESLLYILDKVNNNTKFLSNVKLGMIIADECWATSIALEETIDFIKDTIASETAEYEARNHTSSHLDECSQKKLNQNKIISVIGPGSSSITINVQNLLQLFDIPQIGYSATSRDLSDKKQFKTFLRVVPSDYLQVRAMVDIVKTMNWTYLIAAYTDGTYGVGGMEAFRQEVTALGICLALYEKIREYATEIDFDQIVIKMNQTREAKVIVCFCYGETVRGLLGAIHRHKLKGRFIILGSDGWSDRNDVATNYYEEALGSLSVKAYSPLVREFDNYFINLNPSNNLRNIWFNEYWEQRFNCYVDEASKVMYSKPCKRKCPLNFIELDRNCYYFSEKQLDWYEASRECIHINSQSRLLEFKSQSELNQIMDYLIKNNMTEYTKMHITSKIWSDSDELEFDYNDNKHLIKICPQPIDIHWKDHYNHENIGINKYLGYDSEKSHMFDTQVYTLFNSRHNFNQVKCMSLFTEFKNLNSTEYCIDLSKCDAHLPFICKIKADIKSNIYTHKLDDYLQDPKMSYVMNSFLAIAHGLDRAHKKICNTSGMCDNLKKLNGLELFKFIKETSFRGITHEEIYFDSNGDPGGRYAILNVQKEVLNDNQTVYKYKEVGKWDNNLKLDLKLDQIIFPFDAKSFNSICSEPCKFGHVKQIKSGINCCWNCKKCENYSFVLDEFTCSECKMGYWPNYNLTGCVELENIYLKWNAFSSLIVLIISVFGIILNTFVTYVFIKFSNTCIVKATTRELSYLMLVGFYLAYFLSIPLIMKPNVITCYLSRILPGFSLSLMYGALFTKTNRIARILNRRKNFLVHKKPRFMTITAQIVIACFLILGECFIILIFFINEPEVTEVIYPQRNLSVLQCHNSVKTIIGPLGYNMFLVLLCTIYSIKTRNIPENFNEAKFIGFSMYTTCVIWLAFIPLYFGSDYKVITLCLSTSFSATVLITFLFLPKIYIILFQPEKNQRSSFTTNPELRCHYGGSTIKSNTSSNNQVQIRKGALSHSNNNASFKHNKSFKTTLKHMFSSDKVSIDSYDTFASNFYKVTDRSCQTSLYLINSNASANNLQKLDIDLDRVNLKKRNVKSRSVSLNTFT